MNAGSFSTTISTLSFDPLTSQAPEHKVDAQDNLGKLLQTEDEFSNPSFWIVLLVLLRQSIVH